ncbi:MAG: ATP-binding protein [Oscillospiraceae bacterium]|nr:ATP-binding protein [Oscillospiraceae bacterium]
MKKNKNRDNYMKVLLEFKDKNAVKIITGVRRCGKSTLLDLFIERLLEDGIKEENIIKMNFESIEHDDIKEYKALYKSIQSKISNNDKTYLIFDEIQMVKHWEKAVNSFLVDFNVDIYITGSNAYLLSSELSTLLSGRYVEVKMLPLSFKEYLDFNIFETNMTMDEKFQLFVKNGAMPVISEYEHNRERIIDVLEGIYSTVILKDVVARNKLTDALLLKKVVMFLADNIGNITSSNNIGNVLGNEGDIENTKRNPASRTIDNYIKYLENAYIFYGVRRYDVKGKQYLKTLGKHYIVDTGIRNMLLGYKEMDRGHVLENIVYFELIRRGYEVYIGKIGENEIDFIAVSASDKKYIQVTETMLGEETRVREITPLRDIDDNYEKIILTSDRIFTGMTEEGIKIVNVIDYLIEEDYKN